jgi:hypothetical protein
VHDIGVVIAGEDVAGSSHVRCQLVDFIKSAIYDRLANMRIAQIPQDELVCGGRGMLVILDVYPPDPVAASFEILDKMATDEASGSAD